MRRFVLFFAFFCIFSLSYASEVQPCFYFENLDLTMQKIVSVYHDDDDGWNPSDMITLDNRTVWDIPWYQGTAPVVGMEVGFGVYHEDSREYEAGWRTCLILWDAHYREIGRFLG